MKIAMARRITKKGANLWNGTCPSRMSMVSYFSTNPTNPTWSRDLLFASPESDFVSAPKSVHSEGNTPTGSLSTDQTNPTWSENLSFASPESDFTSARKTVHSKTIPSGRGANIDSIFDELFRNHHLYVSPETATGSIAYSEMLDQTIKDIIMKRLSLKEILPKTMEDALNDERPIIITTVESPFRVVDVNGAWEGLCGYRRDEAIGRNLGSLLQGPETNIQTANDTVRALRTNGFSEAILTNYTKSGHKFKNHLKLGMISGTRSIDISSDETYFVGVLNDTSHRSNEQTASL
uniref:PAS domain-containing protein n=1 Tax=Pseudo-nitzschia australis TaxID=44445 RepID=A0A7S4ABA0_9STRA